MDLAPPSPSVVSGRVRPHGAPPRPSAAAVPPLDDQDRPAPGTASPTTTDTMPPGVPDTWPYPDVALPRLLADAARDFPTVAAVAAGRRSVTHADMASLVDRLATGLRDLGARRVVLGPGVDLTTVLACHAAWRAGLPVLVLASAPSDGEDRPATTPHAGNVDPPLPGDGDVVVGDRELLARAGDATRLLGDVAPLLRPRRGLRSLRRLRPGRPPRTLADLAAPTAGRLPGVAPATTALVVADGHGGVHAFSHADLVVATFQARLWLPDVAAGVEHVGAALPLGAPGLVFGLLLAALVAGTLHVHGDDHVAALRGVTLAAADAATWRRLAARRRLARPRRGPDAAMLRIGGVVVTDDAGLSPDEARRLARRTDGARIRHFWQPPGAAGPVLAQPVYGRIVGEPGGVPLPDTVLWRRAGRLLARGPQLRLLAGRDGWADVTDRLPATTVSSREAP